MRTPSALFPTVKNPDRLGEPARPLNFLGDHRKREQAGRFPRQIVADWRVVVKPDGVWLLTETFVERAAGDLA